MARYEQDLVEEHRKRLQRMNEAERAQYWADSEEAEQLAKAKAARREHLRHQLGVALIWLSTVVLAFGSGYSQNRNLGQVASLSLVWGVLVIGGGGVLLVLQNRHRRDQDG